MPSKYVKHPLTDEQRVDDLYLYGAWINTCAANGNLVAYSG